MERISTVSISNPFCYSVVSYKSFPRTLICAETTAYLKSVTYNFCRPFLVDLIATYRKGVIDLVVIWSLQHLLDYERYGSCDYILFYQSRRYENQIDCSLQVHGQLTLRYVIPTTHKFVEGELLQFTLYDVHLRHYYSDLLACVRLPKESKAPLAVCAYVSDANSAAEIRSFVAYHKLQQASFVTLYSSSPASEMIAMFPETVKEGFVRVVDFSWPRINREVPEIINNQHAQLNSCFYRVRNEAKAVLLCDVDEYVYSESSSVIKAVAKYQNTQFDVLYVRSVDRVLIRFKLPTSRIKGMTFRSVKSTCSQG